MVSHRSCILFATLLAALPLQLVCIDITKEVAAGQSSNLNGVGTGLGPSPGPEADMTGDPHMKNLAGEKFELTRTGKHTALHIPRGSNDANKLYQLQLFVVERGEACASNMFTTKIMAGGSLLGSSEHITFHADRAFTVKVDDKVTAHTSGMLWTMAHDQTPPEGWPSDEPTFTVSLRGQLTAAGRRSYELSLGAVSTRVEVVGKGQLHFLNMEIQGVSKVKLPIGGLLGMDSHVEETRGKALCENKRKVKLVSEHSELSKERDEPYDNFLTIS